MGKIFIKDLNNDYVSISPVLTIPTDNGREITISLPNDFATATQIYYFQVNDNKILISANLSNIGVWEYTVSSQTLVQKYSSGTNWQYFQLVGNNCLISGGTGVLLYDSVAETITRLYSSGTWGSFKELTNGDCLIGDILTYGTSGGILLYKASNNSISLKYSGSYSWKYFILLNNNNCLISSGVSNSGLLLYDSLLETITQISQIGNRYEYSHILNNGNYLISSTLTNYGLWLFNTTTNIISQISTIGGCWKYFQTLNNNNCLISGGSNYGILLYDITDDSIINILSGGYIWQYYQPLSNGNCLIGSNGQSSSGGLLLYNITDNTISQIYNGGTIILNIFIETTADNYKITSDNTRWKSYVVGYDNLTQTAQLVEYKIEVQ